jgi:hypothetical protein
MKMENIVKEEMKTKETKTKTKTTFVKFEQQKKSKSFWQKTKSFFSKKVKQFNEFNKKPMSFKISYVLGCIFYHSTIFILHTLFWTVYIPIYSTFQVVVISVGLFFNVFYLY